jgi:hypothetical protein
MSSRYAGLPAARPSPSVQAAKAERCSCEAAAAGTGVTADAAGARWQDTPVVFRHRGTAGADPRDAGPARIRSDMAAICGHEGPAQAIGRTP